MENFCSVNRAIFNHGWKITQKHTDGNKGGFKLQASTSKLQSLDPLLGANAGRNFGVAGARVLAYLPGDFGEL